MNQEKLFFGIDIGGTTLKFAVAKKTGEIVKKWAIPTDQIPTIESLYTTIAHELGKTISEFGVDAISKTVGIGIPGPVHPRTKNIPMLSNIGWGAFTMEHSVTVEGEEFLIHPENDANLAALGEYFSRQEEHLDSMLFVGLGTGLGGGFIYKGTPFTGSTGYGCEIGHTKTGHGYTYKCGCGDVDCVETVCSSKGLNNLMTTHLGEPIEIPELFKRSKEQEPTAVKIVEEFSMNLGRTLANAATLYDPSLIVIGGGIRKGGDAFINQVIKYYKKYALSNLKEVPVTLSVSSEDAGLIGACLYPSTK